MTQHNAIPTAYKGIRFRSRLEATWAAFLDGMGWPWEYEPFDLKGYIPDFVIKFKHEDWLLEVKPATRVEDLYEHKAKIEASGWVKPAMIVGASLIPTTSDRHGPALGIYGTREDEEWLRKHPEDRADPWVWEEDTWLNLCVGCHRPMIFPFGPSCFLCDVDGWEVHRRSGLYFLPIAADYINSLWAEAKNKTQWKGSGG